MKNYSGKGETIQYLNASGETIVSGEMVRVGSLLAIAAHDILNGDTGTLNLEGVYALPKLDAAVIGLGETVDFDISLGVIDDNALSAATGDLSDCGIAMEAKGATTGETILVKINVRGGTIG